MPEVDDITIKVIFPIGQSLYDAVSQQLSSTGASLDQLYSDACASIFARLLGAERQHERELRSFHIEELGNRENMGALMQATLVLSPQLHAALQAIAGDQNKPVEAICERLCVEALHAKAGASALP